MREYNTRWLRVSLEKKWYLHGELISYSDMEMKMYVHPVAAIDKLK